MKQVFIQIIGCILGLIVVQSALAQDNWQHTEYDRKEAVDTDSLTKKGYTLIWINKDKDFNPALKERLISTFFMNYPKLAKKYNKKTMKKVFFVIDPDYKGVAATAGGIVRYNPAWFAKNPGDIDVVTHEVMHIVQGYPNGSGPWWITEGIADYVRFVDGIDNAGANWKLPEWSAKQKYTDSYRITARFFFWIEKKFKKGFVKNLDLAMRDKTYTEEFWKKQTGKTLDQLWLAYGQDPSL
ncbi:basic secretory family protein [Sphingobacterium sp. SRCM116780]|uniref:basic secretory family protein n=1 Tax=Sphingobacterium sp. SRCM116780 TaxID=2907623 RepID=UPI001F2CDEBE|nr:basic secretory family protein [Sphingobacterium sp. SRCM116780]UIR56025.1 basic secretory family protein [Sphingobacterium sp. SRCM116780]